MKTRDKSTDPTPEEVARRFKKIKAAMHDDMAALDQAHTGLKTLTTRDADGEIVSFIRYGAPHAKIK